MERLTLIERLVIVLNGIFSSHLLLYIVGFMILGIGTFLISRKIQNKKINILIICSWILFVSALIAMAFPVLAAITIKTFQQLLTQYYFPSIATLFFILILTYIVGVSSFFKMKHHKVVATINQVFFGFMNILYSLLIYYIIEKNIKFDLGIILYKEEQLLAILETITFVFAIWMLINIIYSIASWLTKKIVGNEKKL